MPCGCGGSGASIDQANKYRVLAYKDKMSRRMREKIAALEARDGRREGYKVAHGNEK